MEEHVFGTTESQTSHDYTEWTDTDCVTTGPDRDGEAGWQSGSERVDGVPRNLSQHLEHKSGLDRADGLSHKSAEELSKVTGCYKNWQEH